MFTNCKRCNMPFVEEEGQVDCPLCREEFGTNKPEDQEEQTPEQKISDLESENWDLRMENSRLCVKTAGLELVNGMLRRDRSTGTFQNHGLSGKLKHLISLCHPDKHKGSKIATDVTVWLLSQRNTFGG
mgnify:CR=1 FL=1|jgi:hypothetical protein